MGPSISIMFQHEDSGIYSIAEALTGCLLAKAAKSTLQSGASTKKLEGCSFGILQPLRIVQIATAKSRAYQPKTKG